jgi:hypothetical protein
MRKKDENKMKLFQTLYLSRRYNLTELSKELRVCRTTINNWKRQVYPTAKDSTWRKRMFIKLYNSGCFTMDEMTGLLQMHPAKVIEFKRKIEKYNIEITQSNKLNNSNLKDGLLDKGLMNIN